VRRRRTAAAGGYEQMKQREAKIPPQGSHLTEAIDIHLGVDTGRLRVHVTQMITDLFQRQTLSQQMGRTGMAQGMGSVVWDGYV
jgi:hypothetical protein